LSIQFVSCYSYIQQSDCFITVDNMSIAKDDFLTGGRDVLARSLRGYRLRKEMSQKELADACGITQATVSEIETGKGNPTFDVICKLAMALDIPPFALIGAGTALGVIGTVMAAKSLGDVVGKLLAKAGDAPVNQWIIGELLDLARTSLAKAEARVSTGFEASHEKPDSIGISEKR